MAKNKATEYISTPQREVLLFVGEYIKQFGYAPTQQEISQAIGMNRSNVAYNLIVLARKGYVDKASKRPRNIKV